MAITRASLGLDPQPQAQQDLQTREVKADLQTREVTVDFGKVGELLPAGEDKATHPAWQVLVAQGQV